MSAQTKCGFAAIIGAPNAGKSTLVNQLVGTKVSIVTHKVQTTRFPIRGVMMHGDREDNPIPEMLPNAGTNPDNIITTISGIGNDGGDW